MATAKKAPRDLTSLTKKELQQTITKLGGTYKAKDTKEKLIATISQLQPAAELEARRGSSKQELRQLFDANGYVTNEDIDAIARQLGVKRESVQTALSDLQNPKWAKGPVLKVQKKGDRYALTS
jgi:NADH:ubiquinone oxidoreductase subunit E